MHVLALDFLSWIMVRMIPDHFLISPNNAKARREVLILMDSLYWCKIHLCFEIAIEKHALTAGLPRFMTTGSLSNQVGDADEDGLSKMNLYFTSEILN